MTNFDLKNTFDVIIIGAGPIGLACGIEAQKAGFDYVIIDKACLVNSIYNYPVNMVFFSDSTKLEIGKIPFTSSNPKPTRAEALEYYRRVSVYYGLNIRLFEEVEKVDSINDKYSLRSNKASYVAKNIIVATGFYDTPIALNIPGEELNKVTHYYRDPHYYTMQNVVVIGASNSSVDSALETYRKGAHVTMVVREPEIGEHVKYWVRPDILNRIKDGSITAWFNSELTEIRPGEVDIKTPQGLVTIPNDFVLAMTGYQPNFELLDEIGINFSTDKKLLPDYNENSMETNQRGVYMAGVVCGGMDTHQFAIENSREHGGKIIKDILEKMKIINRVMEN